MSKLTDRTLVPIGIAVVCIGSAATWMTTIHLETNANASRLQSMIQREESHRDDISTIKTDIAIIKNEMKRITAKCELRVKGPLKEPTQDEP